MDRVEKQPNRLASISLIGQTMLRSFLDMKEKARQGRKIVWANGLPGFLLARGADMPVLHAEGLVAGLAAKGLVKPLQDAAEAFGLLPGGCSYARSFIGLARIVNGDFELGSSANSEFYDLPPPDLYINVPGAGCGTGRLWGDSVAAVFDVPAFHLEPRFNWSNGQRDAHREDFIRQERELIEVLEEVTGKPYDWDRLKETLVEAKKAVALRQEIMDLCKHTPSPASFFDLAACIAPVCHLLGLPGTLDLLEQIKEEVLQRLASGIGSVPDERYRLYWDGIMTWPKLGVLSRKFASLDACVVAGAYTHMLFMPHADLIDPEKPLESLAHNVCDIMITGDYEDRAKGIAALCRDYSIDGLVISETQTCRAFNGQGFAIADGVARILGVPAVTIGGDPSDPRFYSDAQVDTRLQALIETIDAQKRFRQPKGDAGEVH